MNAVQADRLEQVALLLDRGADVNAKDHRGFTALHRAAELGKMPILDLLLERGATSSTVAEGHTPLSLAVDREHSEVAARLRDVS